MVKVIHRIITYDIVSLKWVIINKRALGAPPSDVAAGSSTTTRLNAGAAPSPVTPRTFSSWLLVADCFLKKHGYPQ